jgi:hypothetical protein
MASEAAGLASVATRQGTACVVYVPRTDAYRQDYSRDNTLQLDAGCKLRLIDSVDVAGCNLRPTISEADSGHRTPLLRRTENDAVIRN